MGSARSAYALLAAAALAAAGCRADTPSVASALRAHDGTSASVHPGGALPSWNDGPTKTRIVDFVTRVTTSGGADFVPVSERIAVFDHDGTLWAEQPMYVQLAFAFDRVRATASRHPGWYDQQPFKGVLAGDREAVAATGERGLLDIVAATHADTTTEEFEGIVSSWIRTARHPETGKLYTDMVYQPMLELIAYLRAHQFKTFIVSGGGVEFMRPWTERVYGIPPEQVLGSRARMTYELRSGVPVLFRRPEADLVDDKAGKPVGIQQAIGRRPLVAVGNSDGDFEMLEWTTFGSGPRLGVIVHHTDAVREWAYDRESPVGRLSRALDAALARGWVVADMKNDWNTVFVKTPPPH